MVYRRVGLEKLLSLSKVEIDVANIYDRQAESIAIFSCIAGLPPTTPSHPLPLAQLPMPLVLLSLGFMGRGGGGEGGTLGFPPPQK